MSGVAGVIGGWVSEVGLFSSIGNFSINSAGVVSKVGLFSSIGNLSLISAGVVRVNGGNVGVDWVVEVVFFDCKGKTSGILLDSTK